MKIDRVGGITDILAVPWLYCFGFALAVIVLIEANQEEFDISLRDQLAIAHEGGTSMVRHGVTA